MSMVRHVSSAVPDEVHQSLLPRVQETGRSLEETAADCLTLALRSPKAGEHLRRWTGAWASGVPDASIRHDDYLGEALSEDLKDRRDD